MLKTNIDKLVKQSVQGKIHHPVQRFPYRIDGDGVPNVLPATGGITYNVKVGDCAFGWTGDHVEPGVSIRNENKDENAALNLLACIGNEAIVISGDSKGAKGFVTGKHGGVDHVLIYFEKEDLEKMAVDDKILIKAYGQGLKLLDFPEIKVMNIDPNLFLKLGIKETDDGKIEVPVAAEVPPYLMGSGIGSSNSFSGDYDIMTLDRDEIRKLGLDKLKFGDLVLLRDCDNTYGRGYLKGAVSIGIVIHSDCIKMGHGPGITTIMTCKKELIKGRIASNANIANYLGVK
ncbi:DUF4438 domain-containing protein [Caloranaerobacter azorensis]|uniref:DUF4438 domain-containing protein n=2 Tax=Caloranaerobacter azorensis TaxID=116090 RepID=A0A1M5SPM4_9FIRM|nr:DUF4438 domain-containing protein [Caloranaerobacter azorensis]QIB26383.1 DUF4438 domain-containing protein [Caloranaerobacter azorensis]SHH40460.1 protein of unknown function [Caloranaerobacter azorensis DSM 13643]